MRSILRQNCLLDPSHTVLVGVSGGPDSLYLLHVLKHFAYPLIVVHLDHGLRPDSAAEANLLRQQIEAMGLKVILGREEVEAFADVQGQSIEEAARTLRYRFLFQQAKENGAQAVAVGHTADDQVETVLMHLLRGAGLSGLKGMPYHSLPNPWSQDIALVRPLLSTWRDEILAYIEEHALQPIQDPSNLDTRFYRNRLRHELIPYLESYNPGIRKILWRTADILREDYAILEQDVETAWQACVRDQGAGYLAFEYQVIKVQPTSMQRHLIRRAINELRPGLRDVDFDAVERALNFLNTPPQSAQSDLSVGLRLLLEENKLWVAVWEADLPKAGWPQLRDGEEHVLNIPGAIFLPGGWRLSANLAEMDIESAYEQAINNRDNFQIWADGAELESPLKVRNRHPGDRFKPLGMQGHSMKLSDFMVNVKLPRRARENWPLVCSGEDIVWLPGFRLSHQFRLKPKTRQIVHLQLTRV